MGGGIIILIFCKESLIVMGLKMVKKKFKIIHKSCKKLFGCDRI